MWVSNILKNTETKVVCKPIFNNLHTKVLSQKVESKWEQNQS